MQTFLPIAPKIIELGSTTMGDYSQTFKVLDYKRLGKQRVEVYQLLLAIRDNGSWSKHPICKMWRESPVELATYGTQCCAEWISRGYKDTLRDKIIDLAWQFACNESFAGVPWWMGDEDFHASHRSNLLRKNPQHYRAYWKDEPDDLPYVWY